MSKWQRSNGDPVTTESEIRVREIDGGREGYISIKQPIANPRNGYTYGSVYAIRHEYNQDGTILSDEKIVLDANPTFVY